MGFGCYHLLRDINNKDGDGGYDAGSLSEHARRKS